MARLSDPSKKNIQRVRKILVSSGAMNKSGAHKFAQRLRQELKTPGGSKAYQHAAAYNVGSFAGKPKQAQAIRKQFTAQDQRSAAQSHPNTGGKAPSSHTSTSSVRGYKV